MDFDDVYDLVEDLFESHGLYAAGWSFGFDNAERRFGCCHYTTKKITLSESLTELNDEATVREVLLHEIAHFQVGHKAAHGYEFVMACRALGIPGDRCYDSTVVNQNEPPWHGTCPACGYVLKRWRLAEKAQGGACPLCCRENGGYHNRYQLTWRKVIV